jgi:hypothetical protein
MLLPRLHLHDAREIHRNHGGDVSDTKAVRRNVVPSHQAFVEHGKELLQSLDTAFAELWDLSVIHRTGERTARHSRRSISHGLGDREQSLELHSPIPTCNLCLLQRRCTKERRVRVHSLRPGGNRRVVCEDHARLGPKRGHRTLRIDLAIGLAKLFATT